MKFIVLYEKNKIQTERSKQYAEFDYKKVDISKIPTKKQKDGDLVLDWEYLYDYADGYDGVIAITEGNILKGVWGTHNYYRGKSIIQVEYYEDLYRKWTLGATGWYLKGYKEGEYKASDYTYDHEIGHALCKHYNERDDLHLFVNFKKYEEWWDYKDFPKLDWDTKTTRIEWWHDKRGDEIEPKCYVLHCDLGNEESTRSVIVDSPKSVSYNYYVNKDGEVIEYVPFGFEAWHAGVVKNPTPEAKKFFGNKNPNSMSVGICFESRGEDANTKQEGAIRDLIEEHELMPIFAHKEITSYKPQAPLNLKRKLNNLKSASEVKWWLRLLAKFLR